MLKKSILIALFVFLLILQGCSENKNKKMKHTVSKNKNEYVLSSLKEKKFIVTKVKDGFKVKDTQDKVVIFDIIFIDNIFKFKKILFYRFKLIDMVLMSFDIFYFLIIIRAKLSNLIIFLISN